MINFCRNILNFDIVNHIKRTTKSSDSCFWLSVLVTFLSLSLIFLYHGTHFLFGDHDWKYLKYGVPLDSGLFEGRFTQFIPINLLSSGEILPIINNILGILGFSLGISLLARYWQIPHTPKSYILFCLFTAITPYILSFMYFAFIIIPCLSWNFIIISALIFSKKEKTFSLKLTFFSSLLFTFALGGYPPVINLYAVALCTRLLIATLYEKQDVKTLYLNYRYSIINFIIGVFFYKLCLIYLTSINAINPNYYNLQIIPFNQWLEKFILISKDIIKQFFITLPFITFKYKIITFFITILTIFYTVKLKITKKISYLPIILLITLFYSSMITLFLSPSINQTEFSPRIDFFGLLYIYSSMFAIILKSKSVILKNISHILVIFSIIINISVLFEAQKVWHLGYITELNLYKRILKRHETSPNFHLYSNSYIMIQAGSPSYRSKYYHTPYLHPSEDLLDISYIPGMNSGVMWNYFSQYEYANTTSYVYNFIPDNNFINFIKNAKPWPSINSTAVGYSWISTILDENSLETLKKRYIK